MLVIHVSVCQLALQHVQTVESPISVPAMTVTLEMVLSLVQISMSVITPLVTQMLRVQIQLEASRAHVMELWLEMVLTHVRVRLPICLILI